MRNFWDHCTPKDKAFFSFLIAWNVAATVFFLCFFLGVFS